MARKTSKKTLLDSTASYLDKIEAEVQSNQSKASLILGGLIVIVAAILLFNYFNKNKAELGPSQATQIEDVSPQNLPGKYTVKAQDTLFSIAEKYYQDGYKYPEIAKANNLINVDSIQTGQVLDIPKLEIAPASPAPATVTEVTTSQPADTVWGPAITENTYTVISGDWLSKIADRAYGDAMAFEKIAKANNIKNPDLIEPGMVLIIPR